jgi:peptidoglycan/LPS O-acetylase OafA/YrhL
VTLQTEAPSRQDTPVPAGSVRTRWQSFARSRWAKVLLLTLLGLGVRLAYVAAYTRCDPLSEGPCSGAKLSGDAAYYHNAANLLADGEGFIDPYRFMKGGRDLVPVEMADGTIQDREVITPIGHREPTAGHPPAYVVFLGAVSFLGGRSVEAHQVASALLGAAAIPLFALVGRRLVGRRAGLIAAALAAGYVMIWINDGLVMSETAVMVVVPIIMLAGLRFVQRPDVRGALLFGAAGALGALTRAELALFLPIIAAVALLRAALPWRRRIGLYALCGFTALGVVSPWIARNLTTFEEPVYLSNGAGTVLVQTNCDAVYYGLDIGYWNLACGSPMPYGPNGELLDESQRDVVVRERALDYIKGHTARLVTAVIPARIGRMFSVVQPIRQLDLEVLSEDRPHTLSAIGLAQYYALVALAFGGVAALWRRRLPVLPIVLWLGLVAFTAAFAFGNMRYRTSAEPAIVVLAAVAIDALWARLRPRAAPDGTIAAHPVVPAVDRPPTALHRAWAGITGASAPRALPWRRWLTSSTPTAETHTGLGTKMPQLPALDGLRGMAVIGVLLFHGGYAFAEGGFLGVSTFFTLSGFLITNLLVREFDRTQHIALGEFWARRFRRLLPAALAALVGIAAYGWAFGSPEQLAKLRGDIIAALLYVANWRFFFSGQSYGDLFSSPSPVQHFWSLAIEEQFYLLFPLAVFMTLRHGGRRALWAVLSVAEAASLALSFALSDRFDQTYYGTHTRAFELLAGALLAVWWSGRREPGHGRQRVLTPSQVTIALTIAGTLAFAATIIAWDVVGQTSERLARGGLALHAALVAVVIVTITRRGPLASVLAFPPLRWIGLISYGLYLYHWPIFLVIDHDRTGLSTTPLFVVRMLATLAAAVASFFLLEQPIRRGRRVRGTRRALLAAPIGALAVIAAAVIVTIDPPPSKIAYANARVGDFNTIVEEVEPPVTTTAPTVVGGTTVPPVPAAATVMIVGDSGMADTAPAIGAAFKAAGTTKVIDASSPGLGLTRKESPYRDVWRDLIAEHDPDLIVVMLGGWDLDYLAENGDAAYAAVVDEGVGLLTAGGAHVLWLSMMPGGTTPERQVDRVYSQLPAKYPGVVDYFDFEQVLRGPEGDWPRTVTAVDGSTILLRKPDNWHMCPEGAERVAEAALDRAVALGWAPPAGVDWKDGDWRDHERYDDPHDGCTL